MADELDTDGEDINLSRSKISIFHSAVATFHAPSDESGVHGLRRERIRCTPSWRNQGERRDCAFVTMDQDKPGMRGLRVVRVKLFFSFVHEGITYPCALVEWFKTFGRTPDADTGLWEVRPEFTGTRRDVSVLHLDTFLRGAHLLPSFDQKPIPWGFHFSFTLDLFRSFYVNKYIDHHTHETIF